MYPAHLEQQYQRFFLAEFRKLALPFTHEIIKRLKDEVKADHDDSVRADSVTDLLVFVEGLKKEYGNKISQQELDKKVEKNFRLIDAWSRDKTAEAAAKNYVRMNTPQPPSVTGRPTPAGKTGELWMQTVKMQNNMESGLINNVVSQNVKLINNSWSSHYDDITKIIKDGVLSGKGHNAIAKELMQKFNVNESKAKFWARDQASKFFGETTKLRQQSAGIPGYIWRAVMDNITRDSHRMLDGTYHTWNNPPAIQSGKQMIHAHPGEDYNCRCWAEPAFAPPKGETAYTPTPDNTPADWSESEGIRKRMAIDINNPTLKSEVNSGINALEHVLHLQKFADILGKAIPIGVLPTGGGMSTIANGVYSPKSGIIMLNTAAEFPAMTFIHEFGHLLDHNILTKSPYKKELLKAIKKTKAYKELLHNLKNKSLPPQMRKQFEYIKNENELIARAFEQYIIEHKGSDFLLKRDMSLKKNKFKYRYWVDNDANNIYTLFDAIFAKEGLLK